MAERPQLAALTPTRKLVGIAVLIGLMLAGFWIAGRSEKSVVPTGHIDIGMRVSDFPMKALDGSEISVADYRGSVLLINFWASWCVPCRREFPMFKSALKTRKFQLIGVVFQDSPSAARRFKAQFGASWPSVIDNDGLIARLFGVTAPPGIPQTVFVDPGGRVFDHAYGQIRRADLDSRLAELTRAEVTPN